MSRPSSKSSRSNTMPSPVPTWPQRRRLATQELAPGCKACWRRRMNKRATRYLFRHESRTDIFRLNIYRVNHDTLLATKQFHIGIAMVHTVSERLSQLPVRTVCIIQGERTKGSRSCAFCRFFVESTSFCFKLRPHFSFRRISLPLLSPPSSTSFNGCPIEAQTKAPSPTICSSATCQINQVAYGSDERYNGETFHLGRPRIFGFGNIGVRCQKGRQERWFSEHN